MEISPVVAVIATLILSYLIGSIPVGWIVVMVFTGRDVRKIESGRTGGTNVMRAAGFVAGALTAIGDVAKGLSTSLIVAWLMPGDLPFKVWLQVLAPLAAILGHNYSIYLIERRADGKLKLRGGAGGAACFGGAMGLWPWTGAFMLPIAALTFLLIGFASVTTLSIALTATAVFAYLALVLHVSPWEYIAYGVISVFILAWALRPNLVRLAKGNERAVGLRAYLQKRRTVAKN
jgi:glycerol-3-phosphate acyltransferase PlsY